MAQNKKYAFIFDIGRVLLDFDYGKAHCKLEKFSPFNAKEIERIFTEGKGKKMFDDYECGLIDTDKFYEGVGKLIDINLNLDEFGDIFSNIFTENKNIVNFLEKAQKYPMAIITNTSEMHWRKVLADSFIKSFFKQDNIIKSYEVGVKKPNLKLYELAKNKLPKESEIIYFDDIEDYVKTATTLGIRGIKYDCRTDDIDQILKENNIFL